MTGDFRRWRNITAVVKHGLDPQGHGLAGVDDRLVHGVAGGEAAGQVGDGHSPGVRFVAGFDCNRISHFVLLLRPACFFSLWVRPIPRSLRGGGMDKWPDRWGWV